MNGYYVIYWIDGHTTSVRALDIEEAYKKACNIEGYPKEIGEIRYNVRRIVFLP